MKKYPKDSIKLSLLDELDVQQTLLRSFNKHHHFTFVEARIHDLNLLIKRLKNGEIPLNLDTEETTLKVRES